MSSTLRPPLARLRVALGDDEQSGSSRLQRGEGFGRILGALCAVPAIALALLILVAALGNPPLALVLTLGAVAACGLAAVVVWTRRELLEPMRLIREWAAGMCSGDLSTRIGAVRSREFSRLVFHVNRLSGALDMLANDMDDTVTHQTERLAQRNSAIEMLYEVASALNDPRDVRSMLSSATGRLLTLVDGRGAVLRSIGGDGTLVGAPVVLAGFAAGAVPVLANDSPAHGRAAGATGANDDAPGHPVSDGPGERGAGDGDDAVAARRIGGEETAHTREAHARDLGYVDCPDGAEHVMRIPLRYRQRTVGAIDLFMHTAPRSATDLFPLFDSVGKHLGAAMERVRLEAEARALVRVRERTALAHDLHDSLAQTLAGLRMQVRVLEDTLGDGDLGAARSEVARVGNVVEEAHTDLRELLGNFTAPIDERGILAALTDLVDRVKRDCPDTGVFLQHEGPEPELSAAAQLQAVRIVGEALANVRKHAHARAVRVMMRYVPGHELKLLVEDDGVGLACGALASRAGENLGLSIMRERAQRAGGRLLIESEPGEGTRVELRLPMARTTQGVTLP